MSLRFTLCLMGRPVSWLTNCKISSTERKSSFAWAFVMGFCDSGAGAGCACGGWSCTVAPTPGTCLGGSVDCDALWPVAVPSNRANSNRMRASDQRRSKVDERFSNMQEFSGYMTHESCCRRRGEVLALCQPERKADS